jgi:hypothetical protein
LIPSKPISSELTQSTMIDIVDGGPHIQLTSKPAGNILTPELNLSSIGAVDSHGPSVSLTQNMVNEDIQLVVSFIEQPIKHETLTVLIVAFKYRTRRHQNLLE